jgi:hypothetical protein
VARQLVLIPANPVKLKGSQITDFDSSGF